MQITISVPTTDLITSIDVSDDMSLQDLKAYLEAECDISSDKQKLTLDGKVLENNNKTLGELKIKENDLIVVTSKVVAGNTIRNTSTSTSIEPNDDQIELMRQELIRNPAIRPPGSEAVIQNKESFKRFFESMMQMRGNNGGGGAAAAAALQGDPNDPANQERILEMIRQERIEENMANALEYSPETFTSVSMLYIDVELNGHKVKAFVDSGAQKTILSSKLANECGLGHLIDKRFRGQAMGVGSGEILGQIHSAHLKIGETFFPCSFTILDTGVEFLLGLDMLKRHRGVIDLRSNKLILGDAETPFLPENEIPSMFNQQVSSQGTRLGGNIFSPENQVPASAAAPATVSTGTSTSTATTSSPATAAGSAAALRQKKAHSETAINQLMALGFSRERVIEALDACEGNPEFAASLLFQ